MKLKTLAGDTTLVPTSLKAEDRSMRGGFIVIRVRQIRSAASDPEDIPDADIPALKTQLTTEITQADTAVQQLLTVMKADETAGKLYKLQDVDARMKKAYKSQGLISDLSLFRQLTVKVIGWWLIGDDFALAGNANDLQYLADRRLRIIERMMYDVGRVDDRSWTKKTINTDIAGDWKDGWNRMFEYPRIRQDLFLSHCDPAPISQACRKPELSGWYVRGTDNLSLLKRARVNPTAQSLWEQQSSDDYEFFFKSPSTNNPEDALNKLFTPSTDYKSRNLLFCDHVIHILHMEALLFSKKKRSADISWLKNYINNVDGKMRIYIMSNSAEFLAGPKDTTFFKYLRVKVSELQIGDQLIVYNHPAYDKATVGGVWRLENSLVVTTYPKLLLQGHGTHPLTFGQMKNIVVGLFNKEMKKLRDKVESLIQTGGTDTTINFGGRGTLIQRFNSSSSKYANSVQKADWWLRWTFDSEKDDATIAGDPQLKALALQVHKVDYDNQFGYFPLWEPVLKSNGTPVMKAGKISKIHEVIITPEMIAGWTWNLPKDPKDREMTVVLRPKK